ncbi:MAG: hypothetical protein WCG83_00400 [Candidatus Peregrinibacteria bacterium]
MQPIFQSVSEHHDIYDSQFLRVCIAEQHKVTDLQLREQNPYYRNPWLVPWYLAPKCKDTTLRIDDFAADVRSRLVQALTQDIHERHASAADEDARMRLTKEMSIDDIGRAEQFLRYISHTIVQHSASLHTQKIEIADFFRLIRSDLCAIFQEDKLCYVAVTPSNPVWQKGAPTTLANGAAVRQTRSTVPGRKLAQFLAGPTPNIENAKGRIEEYLLQQQPFLLSLDPGNCVRYAIELRRSLHGLLKHKEVFSHGKRKQCITEIINAWVSMLPTDDREPLMSMDDSNRTIEQIIAEHFSPQALSTKELFEQKRDALEQLTLQRISDEMNDEQETTSPELNQLFEVWKQVMTRLRIAACDYPSLGLMLLADNARSASLEEFRANIGSVQ